MNCAKGVRVRKKTLQSVPGMGQANTSQMEQEQDTAPRPRDVSSQAEDDTVML